LNFKLELLNPLKRCTGGHGRNINIFFLLAESMWIWCGRKDVEWLILFNSRMVEFSDDGKYFNAPYGYRLRNWGLDSFASDEREYVKVIDQFEQVIRILSNDKDSRRAVMSIWNPVLDLGRKSKDLACNSMLFLTERNDKLSLTVSNRSNDLHWGLPTNVFQFSFILELLSLILKTEVGHQTHNIQSLHYYLNNDIAQKMYQSSYEIDIYDISEEKRIDFKFDYEDPLLNLDSLTYYLSESIFNLLNYLKVCESNKDFEDDLRKHSVYFYVVYYLLKYYIQYGKTAKTDKDRYEIIEKIVCLAKDYDMLKTDIIKLALNFFYHRIKDKVTLDVFPLGYL